VQAHCQYSPGCGLIANVVSPGWFSWGCSSKIGEFHHFTVRIWVNRFMVGVMVSVRIRVR